MGSKNISRDGLRLLMREEAEKLQWLRNAIAEGEADVAAGRIFTPEQVRSELEKSRKVRRPGIGRRNGENRI